MNINFNKKIINLKLLIIILMIFGFIFNSTAIFVYGQDNDGEINSEIKSLNSEIQSKKEKIKNIQDQQEIYSENIKQKQKDQASLNNQLSILENRVAKAELDIESAEIEMDRINLEIKKVNIEIDDKNQEIEKEKEHIGNILKIIYKNDQKNTLEIILLNDSLVDFLNQMKYLEDVNEGIRESVEQLKKYKEQLEKDKLTLNEKNKDLLDLKENLKEKILALDDEKENKIFILDQVKNSEKEYQKWLLQAKQEEENAAAEIVSLEKTVRQKIENISGKKLEFNDNGLIWPVPKNIITATFHDPEYPFRYIFEHPGIDIRANQGTNLKTAASGYVARAKDAGKGYSYIMIIHGDGLSTVYGHVSKIYVEEDEYVVQGQSIGQSGGMPGTNGAGNLTTGPHLHFEVRLNGIPVNPLEYLP